MIFLNYRKHDTQPTVDHLADRLKAAFGPDQVFKDDADLQGGDRWPDRLRDELARRTVLLAVIGPNWLKAADDFGRRRLDDPDDWVRTEICTAVRTGKTVVVVLADGATPLPAAGLPKDCELQELPNRQTVELRKGGGRADDLSNLIALLARLTGLPGRTDRPPSSKPSTPGLPGRPPVCVGRDELLHKLETLFLPADEAAPLPRFAIAGMGGMGKSTAVLWFLHDERVKRRYGDNRHFVPLDGADTRAGLVTKLAEYLGVEPGPNLEARVLAALEAPGRRLLVLDNAETPLQSNERVQVEDLLGSLAHFAHVGLVATLRPTTCIPNWDDAHPLSRLNPPDDAEAFHKHSGGRFRSDPAAAKFIANLDGWPMVLRLAAERAKDHRRFADFLAEWKRKRTELLAHGKDRGSNFAVSVGLSLDCPLMTPAGRRLLAVLAQLPDGLLHEDREAVLGDDGISAAADVRRVGGLALENDERTWMLAPLQEHLKAVLPLDAADQERMVGYYCAVAAEGEKLGTEEAETAITRVSPRTGACMAMIGLGLQLSDRSRAYEAALGLGEYGRFVGLDHSETLNQAAEVANRCGDERNEANCMQRLGDIALERSDHPAATARFEQALSLFRRVGDILRQASCIRRLGDIAFERLDHPGATARYEQALMLFRQIGQVVGEANCILRLGDIAFERSDHPGAATRYEQALPLYRQARNILGEANCVKKLGNIAFERSDHPGAEARYEQALPLYRRIGSVLGEANCIRSLGDIALERSDHETARGRFIESLGLYQRISEPYSIGRVYQRLARLAGGPAEQAEHVRQAREHWKPLDLPHLMKALDDEFGPESSGSGDDSGDPKSP